jgi:hypothetical protein
MYLLQGLIVFAVVGSNIHWQWTPNPYVAFGLGILLAWAVTWWIVEIRERYARFGLTKRFIFPGLKAESDFRDR